MKMKLFLMMLVISAASLASIKPAMADDMNNGSAQSMGSGSNSGSANTDSSSSSNTMGSSNNTGSGVTPDNATGDDDY